MSTSTRSQPRQPEGTPVGGRFSATSHSDDDVDELAAAREATREDLHDYAEQFVANLDDIDRRRFLTAEGVDHSGMDHDDLAEAAFDLANDFASDQANAGGSVPDLKKMLHAPAAETPVEAPPSKRS